MRYVLITFIVFIFLIIGCEEDTVIDENPYQQEHIPWPSLANSPWPMFHGDPQSTGRFHGTGPIKGEVDTFFTTTGYNYGSVSIGHDDRVIFGTSFDHDGDDPACWIYALSKTGEVLWKTNVYQGSLYGEIHGSPLITSDGKVIIGSPDGKLYCLDEMTGDIIWTYNTETTGISVSPIISREGIILLFALEIFAFELDGTLLWHIENPGMLGVAFSPDGNTFYTSGPVAYDLNGVELWGFEGYQASYPCVDNSGNIYGVNARNNELVSRRPDGSLRWVISGDSLGVEQLDHTIAPTIDIFGNFTAAAYGYLVSVTNEGEHRWTVPLDFYPEYVGSHLVSDDEGTVFVSGWLTGSSLVTIANDGSVKWSIYHGEYGTYGCPAFDSEGNLFILSDYHEYPLKLMKIM